MNTEKQYIQAFNNGYILAQYEPSLLNTVSQNITPANNYLQGLFAGKKEFELENIKDEMLELQQLRAQSLSRKNNLEK